MKSVVAPFCPISTSVPTQSAPATITAYDSIHRLPTGTVYSVVCASAAKDTVVVLSNAPDFLLNLPLVLLILLLLRHSRNLRNRSPTLLDCMMG